MQTRQVLSILAAGRQRILSSKRRLLLRLWARMCQDMNMRFRLLQMRLTGEGFQDAPLKRRSPGERLPRRQRWLLCTAILQLRFRLLSQPWQRRLKGLRENPNVKAQKNRPYMTYKTY